MNHRAISVFASHGNSSAVKDVPQYTKVTIEGEMCILRTLLGLPYGEKKAENIPAKPNFHTCWLHLW